MQGLVIAALLLTSTGPGEDGFCAALREIVASAPGGFEAVAGRALDHGSARQGRVVPAFGEGETRFCLQFPASEGYGERAQYLCSTGYPFETPPTLDEVRALASRTATCFGAEAGATTSGDYTHAFVIRLPTVEIRVGSREEGIGYIGGRKPGPIGFASLEIEVKARRSE